MDAEKVRYTQVSATARPIKQRQPARVSERTAYPMAIALCAQIGAKPRAEHERQHQPQYHGVFDCTRQCVSRAARNQNRQRQLGCGQYHRTHTHQRVHGRVKR